MAQLSDALGALARGLPQDGGALEEGAYAYRCDGELQPIEERWSIHAGDGEQRIIVSHREVPALQLRIGTAALISERRIAAMYTCWLCAAPRRDIASFTALNETILSSERYVYGHRESDDRQRTDSDPLLYPLMRIYLGMTIEAVVARGGAAELVVPDIRHVEDEARLLQPLLSRRTAKLLAADDRERCYQFIGDQYDASARFWLDDSGRLLRYRWVQESTESTKIKHWEVESL